MCFTEELTNPRLKGAHCSLELFEKETVWITVRLGPEGG